MASAPHPDLAPLPVRGEWRLGPDGVLLAADWPSRSVVGRPFLELVDPEDREALDAVRQRGWWGLDERPWRILGRSLAVAVMPSSGSEAGRVDLALHDVTAWALMESARIARRLATSDAELAGGLARELTDPMAVVQGRLELMLELGVEEPVSVRRHVEIAVGHARRVTATLRNLRSVGRRSPDQAIAPLRASASEALDLIGPRSDRVLVTIEPEELEVVAERPLLVRVLSSLIRLALESSGRSMVHLRASRGGGGALIRIGVGGRDTGAPLAAEIDLSLDRALLQCIGGEVKAFSTPHGASFDLWLATPSKGRVRALRRTSNLWVVGQQAVREAVVTLLDHEGYSLWHTGDPSEALARDPAGCDSLISELLLPRGWSGLSLSRALLAARRVPCVLVGERQPACSWPGVRFVTLPLSRVALTQALRGGATEEARVAGAAGDG